MRKLQKIKEYLKEAFNLNNIEIDTKKSLNLAETLNILKYWQEYRILYESQYLKVNPFNIVLKQDGNLYYKENKTQEKIGKINECLYTYDSILEQHIDPNFFKISLETGFLFKGQSLTKKQKEILNNQFFKHTKEIQKTDFKNLSIEKYV